MISNFVRLEKMTDSLIEETKAALRSCESKIIDLTQRSNVLHPSESAPPLITAEFKLPSLNRLNHVSVPSDDEE